MSFSPFIFHWIVCLKCLLAWVESKSYWYALSIDYLFMLNSFEVPSCFKYLTKDSWLPFSLLCSQTWCSFHFTKHSEFIWPCQIFPVMLPDQFLNLPWLFVDSIAQWIENISFHLFYLIIYPTKTNKQTLNLTTSLKSNTKSKQVHILCTK